MSVRDLISWNRGNNNVPSVYREDDMDPFLSLHRNVNRLFDEVFPRVWQRLAVQPNDSAQRNLAARRVLGE